MEPFVTAAANLPPYVTPIFTVVATAVLTYMGTRLHEDRKAFLSQKAAEQDRKRVLYLEFGDLIEEVFEGKGNSLAMRKLFTRLAFNVPDDDVFRLIRDTLIRGDEPVLPEDVKPKIYSALRKSLFGNKTKLTAADFPAHIAYTSISPSDVNAIRAARGDNKGAAVVPR